VDKQQRMKRTHSQRSDADCSQPSTQPFPTPAAEGSSYNSPDKLKPIHDRLYRQIKLEPLLVHVLDTPQFQRLAEIKQLGGSSYVYPSANHTRKEHSIGVAHLAGEACKHLRVSQPELCIDDEDVLCVKLAGLVHDIGHGPFSHMFEDFIHKYGRELAAKGETEEAREQAWEEARPFVEWTHESKCEPILRQLVDDPANGIRLSDYFKESDPDERLRFVVALVNGLGDDEPWPSDLGSDLESKRFLFDIVNNKRNGIDVDKLDYLARDAHAAVLSSSGVGGAHALRIINASKVLRPSEGGALQLGYEMKVAQDIKKVFDLRTEQHQNLYKHRVVHIVETMITDILTLANPAFTYRGGGGKPTSLTDAAVAEDCASYVLLNDTIVEQINTSVQPGLDAARELVRRLKSHDYYQQVRRIDQGQGEGRGARHEHGQGQAEVRRRRQTHLPFGARFAERGGCAKGGAGAMRAAADTRAGGGLLRELRRDLPRQAGAVARPVGPHVGRARPARARRFLQPEAGPTRGDYDAARAQQPGAPVRSA